MIVGDIKDETIQKQIIDESIKSKVDFIIATPPCQGMSLAGKMDIFDERKIIKTKRITKKEASQND